MQNETTTGNHFFQIVKGVALALCFSLLAAVVFANVLRATTVPDKAVYPVNQTIKIVAVSIGTLVFVRGEKGFIKGGAIGLLFTALSGVRRGFFAVLADIRGACARVAGGRGVRRGRGQFPFPLTFSATKAEKSGERLVNRLQFTGKCIIIIA